MKHLAQRLPEQAFSSSVYFSATPRALTAMVDIDQLHAIRERGVAGVEDGMVGPRTTMDQEGDRPLAHARATGHEAGTSRPTATSARRESGRRCR